MNPLNSTEMNALVFRYLTESGFTHAAFALGYEAGINKSPIDGSLIPPGSLVKIVQKGLQYVELEVNEIEETDSSVNDDFAFLQPMDVITKQFPELLEIIKEKKAKIQRQREKNGGKSMGLDIEQQLELQRGNERVNQENDERPEKDKGRKPRKKKLVKLKDKKASKVELSTPCLPSKIPSSDVTVFEGHTSEVFACAWDPVGSLLASVSKDSTARIWTILDGPCSKMQNGRQNEIVLEHCKGDMNQTTKDVTALDWNGEGTLLATASLDAQARIWSRDGELRGTSSKHSAAILCIKWNKEGNRLLTGSADKTAIVWQWRMNALRQAQKFEFHSDKVMDVDWRDYDTFATCSGDASINVCKVGENHPVKTFLGHKGEVNSVKWDASGSLLASCSDDCTVKIWSIKQDMYVHDLKKHIKEVFAVKWSPTGPGTSNPNQSPILASASFDTTIKLWDVEFGTFLRSLNGHRDPVCCISFSPNGEYLASGSLGKCLHIWSVKEGRIVKTFEGSRSILEVSWNKEGTKIATCFANRLCVMDVRM
ncbi:hypothetical protein MKW94_017631 [Papaver nudicaule]|uniref:Uncharacterized protein n=1 Tax=Papaver nudicaule TaxID=74823 RepID=A0AA41S7X5_PAPNU|nr:hypothetical protein [Papaver nudicaule]